MREKLKRIPTGLIIAAVLGVLALAAGAIIKTAQETADGSFHMPDMTYEQWTRYKAEMMKRSSSGQGGYQSSGAPGGQRPQTRPNPNDKGTLSQ